ncbi:Protein involved in maintenance of golgi structure and er-golgi transport, partial [Fasciolopsis buskii]
TKSGQSSPFSKSFSLFTASIKSNSPSSVDLTIESPQDSSDPGSYTDVSASPSAYSAANAALVRAPSMWTRGEIREFKSNLADTKDAIVQIGCGEVITVRVPAYPSGTSIVWEFATDDYDIGFGLFFEWSTSSESTTAASYSTSQEREQESEQAFDAQGSERSLPVPVLENSNSTPLVDEIIPVYRRKSHEEVYCGSHLYPGLGTYLFKFDNSYSLWRSKTLYYRVYYTC